VITSDVLEEVVSKAWGEAPPYPRHVGQFVNNNVCQDKWILPIGQGVLLPGGKLSLFQRDAMPIAATLRLYYGSLFSWSKDHVIHSQYEIPEDDKFQSKLADIFKLFRKAANAANADFEVRRNLPGHKIQIRVPELSVPYTLEELSNNPGLLAPAIKI
jgi:hypothetical protein